MSYFLWRNSNFLITIVASILRGAFFVGQKWPGAFFLWDTLYENQNAAKTNAQARYAAVTRDSANQSALVACDVR